MGRSRLVTSFLAHILAGAFFGWLLWKISPPTIKGE
jgi:F0F1-type ATP synthase assembly protein I